MCKNSSFIPVKYRNAPNPGKNQGSFRSGFTGRSPAGDAQRQNSPSAPNGAELIAFLAEHQIGGGLQAPPLGGEALH